MANTNKIFFLMSFFAVFAASTAFGGSYVDGESAYLPMGTNKPSAGQIPYATDSTGKKWGWGTAPEKYGSAAAVQTNLDIAVATLTLGDALRTIQSDTQAWESVSGGTPMFNALTYSTNVTTNLIVTAYRDDSHHGDALQVGSLFYGSDDSGWVSVDYPPSLGFPGWVIWNAGTWIAYSPSGDWLPQVIPDVSAVGSYGIVYPSVMSLSVALITNYVITVTTNTVQVQLASGDGSQLTGIKASQISTVPVALPYVAINVPNLNDGLYRNCTMTGDMTLYGPTNASYGAIWTCYLFATNANRSISFPASILVPSDSGFASPKVLTSGLTYIVQMRYGLSMSRTNWLLNSVVGGY